MEIFAQWLDDLDDLIFALALAWEKVRLRCLESGLLAALLIVSAALVRLPPLVTMVLAYLAAASVALWLAGLVGTGLYGRRGDPRSA